MTLSENELEALIDAAAEKAAKKAVDDALQTMYVEIGKGVLKKAAYVIGLGVIALALWLGSHGFK